MDEGRNDAIAMEPILRRQEGVAVDAALSPSELALFDVVGRRRGFDAGERAVVPTLRALGVRRLDAVVLSHGDNDHAGGWTAVARALPVAAVLAPAGSPVPGLEACHAGMSWQWDGVRVDVLHPGADFPYLGNEASCVLRVVGAHGAVLLAGDIGHYAERALAARDRAACGPVCPPQGLYLTGVGYPQDPFAG